MLSQTYPNACDTAQAGAGVATSHVATSAHIEDRTSFPSASRLRTRVLGALLGLTAGAVAARFALRAGAGVDLLTIGLAVLAFAGGLLSTWSPCGYSSLSTLRPAGAYGVRSVLGWTPTLVMHGVGYAAGALLLGGALGLAAMALPFEGYAGWPVVLLGAVAVGFGLDQLRLFLMPYPQRKAQVPHDARARYPMWVIGLLYGFSLGLNFVTYVRTPILYIVVGAALISGSLTTALLLFGALNLGRFAPLLVNALPVHDWTVQRWLASTEHKAETLDGVLLAAAGAALVVFGLA